MSGERIVGHGIDLVEIERVQGMLNEHDTRFLDRVFTPHEQAGAQAAGKPGEFLSGRFAAKEAALKALGTGLTNGISWTDVSVERLDSGCPRLSVSGRAGAVAAERGISRWEVSISHTRTHAMASVLAIGVSC